MNKRSLGMLIGLNLVLLAAVTLSVFINQPASAQFGLPGDYVMVAGDVTGRKQAAVYILDLKSERMAAVMFDSRNQRLEVIAGRELSNDMRAGPGR